MNLEWGQKVKNTFIYFYNILQSFCKTQVSGLRAYSAKRWVAKSNLEWGHMMSHGIIDFCLYFQGRVKLFFFSPKTLKKSPERDFFVGQNGKS